MFDNFLDYNVSKVFKVIHDVCFTYFHQVPYKFYDVLQVPNVFFKLFPIAPHFMPYYSLPKRKD